MNIEEKDVSEYLKISVNLIENLIKMVSEKDDINEIIDIYGQVIEGLNLLCKYIITLIDKEIVVNNLEVNNIKNETILFKEYCINYVDGLLNPNEYIIEKYKRLIDEQSNIWTDCVNQCINV